jgi:hypothetical protein
LICTEGFYNPDGEDSNIHYDTVGLEGFPQARNLLVYHEGIFQETIKTF